MATENFLIALVFNGFNSKSQEIVSIQNELGHNGLGIFLEILELSVRNEKLPADYKLLSKILNKPVLDYCNKNNLPTKNLYPTKKLKKIVEDFGFFDFSSDGNFFYLSTNTIDRMNLKKVISEYRIKGGK